MKNTILCIAFISCMVVSWLLFSILWNFFDTEHTYIEVLRHPAQLAGLLLLYWWIPGVFVMEDVDNYFKTK